MALHSLRDKRLTPPPRLHVTARVTARERGSKIDLNIDHENAAPKAVKKVIIREKYFMVGNPHKKSRLPTNLRKENERSGKNGAKNVSRMPRLVPFVPVCASPWGTGLHTYSAQLIECQRPEKMKKYLRTASTLSLDRINKTKHRSR
jgi:hypothetical protein